MSSQLTTDPFDRHASHRSVFHYLRHQNASERASTIMAALTLAALAAPFFVSVQRASPVENPMIGWELATVDGNRIGAWRWIDATGG